MWTKGEKFSIDDFQFSPVAIRVLHQIDKISEHQLNLHWEID